MDIASDKLFEASQERFLSIDALADSWSMSTWTIKNLMADKDHPLPYYQISPKNYRFDPVEIRKWLQESRQRQIGATR